MSKARTICSCCGVVRARPSMYSTCCTQVPDCEWSVEVRKFTGKGIESADSTAADCKHSGGAQRRVSDQTAGLAVPYTCAVRLLMVHMYISSVVLPYRAKMSLTVLQIHPLVFDIPDTVNLKSHFLVRFQPLLLRCCVVLPRLASFV